MRTSLFVCSSPLRGLEGVDFVAFPVRGAFKVSGEVASASVPLDGGMGGYCAESAFGEALSPGATLALIDDRVALAAVEIAPFSGHERTLDTLFQRYALHGFFLSSDLGMGGIPPLPSKRGHNTNSW